MACGGGGEEGLEVRPAEVKCSYISNPPAVPVQWAN